MGRYLFSLLLVLLLSGCSMTDKVRAWMGGTDNSEPPAPLVEFRQRLNVVELWSRNTGSGTDEQYLKLAPIIAGQRVFIADTDGSLEALDATNGQQQWSVRAIHKGRFWSRDDVFKVTAGPGYGENTILIGTNEGDVIAFSADRGQELWRSRVSSEILSTPIREDGVVVVRTNDGKIFALNGSNGRRLWSYDRGVPSLSLRGTGNPVISGSSVIAGFDEGRLVALDLHNGRELWEARITTPRGSSELERLVDIDSEPIVINGLIYVASYQGHMASVQLETGRILWTQEISSYAGFSADADNIYISDDDSHVWAYDRYTGTSLWEQDKLSYRNITAPAVLGDFIVVGDLRGYLHWMIKDSGRFIARTRLSGDPILVAPIVVGNILYAFSSDGKLAAYTYR